MIPNDRPERFLYLAYASGKLIGSEHACDDRLPTFHSLSKKKRAQITSVWRYPTEYRGPPTVIPWAAASEDSETERELTIFHKRFLAWIRAPLDRRSLEPPS